MEKFYKRTILLMLALASLLLCASCGKPRPMTFEEQQIYMARQQCSQSATDMNPGWPSSANPAWYSYYAMCMNQFGITDEQLRHMWY